VKEARQRRDNGESVAKIARHMNADEETVKAWLSQKRKEDKRDGKKTKRKG
jgi:transposase-like protein